MVFRCSGVWWDKLGVVMSDAEAGVGSRVLPADGRPGRLVRVGAVVLEDTGDPVTWQDVI